jgi:High potential iron-sulfur protein
MTVESRKRRRVSPPAKTTLGSPSRRKLIFSVFWASVLANGIALVSGSQSASAQQKVSKDQAKYQDSPNEGKKCSECTFFIKPGSCKVVDGAISPDGWCQLWTKAA